ETHHSLLIQRSARKKLLAPLKRLRLATTGRVTATHDGIGGDRDKQYHALNHQFDVCSLIEQVEAVFQAADDERAEHNRPDGAASAEEADAADDRRGNRV